MFSEVFITLLRIYNYVCRVLSYESEFVKYIQVGDSKSDKIRQNTHSYMELLDCNSTGYSIRVLQDHMNMLITCYSIWLMG